MSDQQQEIINFSEYQMFFESAERVTDRRINLNRTNYTICVAIITGIGVAGSWALDKDNAEMKSAIFSIICLLCLSSVVLCLGWLRQITDLKLLNNAKFTVIGQMELQLFASENGAPIPSFRPFDKEWSTLIASKGTSKLLGIRVLKGSFVEYILPITLISLFLFVFIYSVSQVRFSSPENANVPITKGNE
jgi:hypothetical protein